MKQHATRIPAADRKEAILRAATPLFARLGRAATTTKDIAKAAGISEALLYRHFEGKEALYTELENHCVRAGQVGSQLLEQAKPSTATLVQGVAVLVHAVFLGIGARESHEDTKRLVTSSLLDDGRFAKSFLERHVEPWVDLLGTSLSAAQASGDVEEGVHAGKAELWFTHHLANTLHLVSLPAAAVIDYGSTQKELTESAIRFLLRGLGVKSAAIRRYYDPVHFEQLLESMGKESQ